MKETKKARAARLAARNARQQRYRARPGRAEAEALASRKSYWRGKGALVRSFGTSAQCTCRLCKRAYAAIVRAS